MIVCVMVYQLHPVALYTGRKPLFLVVERFAKGLALISAKPLADSCFPALNFYVTKDGDVKNCRLKRDLLTDNT